MNHTRKINSPLKAISLLLSITMILGSQPVWASTLMTTDPDGNPVMYDPEENAERAADAENEINDKNYLQELVDNAATEEQDNEPSDPAPADPAPSDPAPADSPAEPVTTPYDASPSDWTYDPSGYPTPEEYLDHTIYPEIWPEYNYPVEEPFYTYEPPTPLDYIDPAYSWPEYNPPAEADGHFDEAGQAEVSEADPEMAAGDAALTNISQYVSSYVSHLNPSAPFPDPSGNSYTVYLADNATLVFDVNGNFSYSTPTDTERAAAQAEAERLEAERIATQNAQTIYLDSTAAAAQAAEAEALARAAAEAEAAAQAAAQAAAEAAAAEAAAAEAARIAAEEEAQKKADEAKEREYLNEMIRVITADIKSVFEEIAKGYEWLYPEPVDDPEINSLQSAIDALNDANSNLDCERAAAQAADPNAETDLGYEFQIQANNIRIAELSAQIERRKNWLALVSVANCIYFNLTKDSLDERLKYLEAEREYYKNKLANVGAEVV